MLNFVSFVSVGDQVSGPYQINFYRRLPDSDLPYYEAATRRIALETWRLSWHRTMANPLKLKVDRKELVL
jgi:hypothetical protein